MLTLPTRFGNVNVVETAGELPELSGVNEVFMDFETTHFDKHEERLGKDKNKAVRPYNGDRICGVALARDDETEAFYIPVRHTNANWNVDLECFLPWLQDAVTKPKSWVNSNVKFDAHFAAVDNALFDCELVDTIVESKIHNSDRFSHDLKSVIPDWLGLPMEQVDEVGQWLKDASTTNYARVPADILGKYAAEDVLGNRLLHRWLTEQRPSDLDYIWGIEKKFSLILWDMEHAGLRVDKRRCKKELLASLRKLVEWSEELENLIGREYTDSAQSNFDIFCVQLGLPVLKYGEKKDETTGRKVKSDTASFDAEALALYSIHPAVTSDPRKQRVVELITSYREESTFKSLFLESYIDRADENGRIHPYYNQLVRTGRTSCGGPNIQQANDRAKELIEPEEGEAFFGPDASQVEYRFIVHYMRDEKAIAAYRDNPNTDFHQWVADLCGIERKPAKNVNFAMGYGAGKRKILHMLRNDPSVMKEVGDRVTQLLKDGKIREEQMNAIYTKLCARKAEDIYNTYHRQLPRLKPTAEYAEQRCKMRGFSLNAFKRRRHLPTFRAHTAFNTIVQGGAMDYVKHLMIRLSPRWNVWTRERGLRYALQCHDQILFAGDAAIFTEDNCAHIISELERPLETVKLRVPFVWSANPATRKNWKEAS